MAEISARTSPSSDWSLFLPCLAIGVVYGLVSIFSPPHGKKLAEVQNNLRITRSSAISEGLIEQQTTKRNDLQKQVATKRVSLNEDCKKAEYLSGKTENQIAKISLLQQVGVILTNHSLVVTSDQDRQASESLDLTKAFRKAQSDLLSTLAESDKIANPAPLAAFNPQMFPDGIPPELLPGAPQQRQVISAPPMQIREFEVWGSYGNMQRAISEITEACGDSVVVAVSFERHLAGKQPQLQWKLLCNLRPSLEKQQPYDESNLASNTP